MHVYYISSAEPVGDKIKICSKSHTPKPMFVIPKNDSFSKTLSTCPKVKIFCLFPLYSNRIIPNP